MVDAIGHLFRGAVIVGDAEEQVHKALIHIAFHCAAENVALCQKFQLCGIGALNQGQVKGIAGIAYLVIVGLSCCQLIGQPVLIPAVVASACQTGRAVG